jgi:hypothetical protein
VIRQGEDGIDRGQVDDRPRRAAVFNLGDHLSRGGLPHQERAFEVHADHPVEIGLGQVEEVGAVEHGGVVDQHVQPAFRRGDARDQRAHRGRHAHVAGREARLPARSADRLGRCQAASLVHIGEDHARAFGGEAFGHGAPDALGSACDDDGFSGE